MSDAPSVNEEDKLKRMLRIMYRATRAIRFSHENIVHRILKI